MARAQEAAEVAVAFASLKLKLIVAGVAAVAVLILFGIIAAVMVGGMGSVSAAACQPVVAAPIVDRGGSNASDSQISNARAIDEAATKAGLSGQASRIGIIAAMGESSLMNISYGDNAVNPDGSIADSIGLFQQQSSWGTVAQRMDPIYAATSFFLGPHHDGTGGLAAVAGWEQMTPTLAIHTVEVNADPDHYARYYSDADSIVAAAGIDTRRAGDGVAGATSTVQAVSDTQRCAGSGTSAAGGSGTAVYPLTQPFNMTDTFGPRADTGVGASTWHPALDLQNYPGPCGDPVYASLPGTVTLSDRLTLSVQSPEGFTVSYLHMHKTDRLVDVGAQVQAGQQIGLTGDESPATGCHIDVRVDATGSTNAQVTALPRAGSGWGKFVNTFDFYRLYGLDICPDWCVKNY
ncbi:M23 family metallopeptidase [Rathayibacter rathayi]|uniref:M23 family peptidase n=1 Tax=Rathayibacter rathayi TaxID=33887 RepID=A0ABD6W7I2_RATRA|nr:M23 family metallopeptidase [Rathayibacter rathayi]MWV75859.1 peptidoglycan DD-metalloendopeptidase family protein [Rathayibacter rathayi NCPPB 2980 = VKM Ac-1601]PPF11947.1 M23 family peptidase [Rathayibacter rathayi]PPF45186.1 M23 family peptidase [Rathayibacter rathayi]PPF77705.1 M23 family peptidase [Rathayibacter rathayi]PPG11564.1 M23 family peptidase [Rathayibacter rathayi]